MDGRAVPLGLSGRRSPSTGGHPDVLLAVPRDYLAGARDGTGVGTAGAYGISPDTVA